MDCVFIGSPCREEIELHLRNRRYSLLNNTGLRREIRARRVLQKDAESAVKLEFEFVGRLQRRASRVLGERSINTMHLKDAEQHKRLVEKNTAANSGYRFVRLSFRDEETAEEAVAWTRERAVRFSEMPSEAVHNAGEVEPILLPANKPAAVRRARTKETVPVKTLPEDDELC